MLPVTTMNELRDLPINVLVSGSGPCGYVELKDWMGDEQTIADVARVGTGSTAKSPHDDQRLITRLIKDGHSSPFEFCEIHFELRLPIFTLRQLFRYRTANQQEQSGRYRELPGEFYLPSDYYRQHPSNRQMSGETLGPRVSGEVATALLDSYLHGYGTYRALVEAGLSREQARMALPLGLMTTVRWKIDLHNLLHVLEQRVARDAQAEIRGYANVLAAIVKLWLPTVWAAFVEHRLDAVRLSASEVRALRSLPTPSEELVRGDPALLQVCRRLGLGSLAANDPRQLELPL